MFTWSQLPALPFQEGGMISQRTRRNLWVSYFNLNWPARHGLRATVISYTCGLRARLPESLRASSHPYHSAQCAPIICIIWPARQSYSLYTACAPVFRAILACAPVICIIWPQRRATVAFIVYGLRAYLLRPFGLRASHLYHLVCAPII